MSTRDQERRAYEERRARIAEIDRDIAYNTGRVEATYEGLRHDAEFVEVATQAANNRGQSPAVYIDEYIAGKIARLRKEHTAPGPSDDAPVDPAVRRFRELLS